MRFESLFREKLERDVTASIYAATRPPGVFSSMTRHAERSQVAELELRATVFERHDAMGLEILARTAGRAAVAVPLARGCSCSLPSCRTPGPSRPLLPRSCLAVSPGAAEPLVQLFLRDTKRMTRPSRLERFELSVSDQGIDGLRVSAEIGGTLPDGQEFLRGCEHL